jgi:hypothetical protein
MFMKYENLSCSISKERTGAYERGSRTLPEIVVRLQMLAMRFEVHESDKHGTRARGAGWITGKQRHSQLQRTEKLASPTAEDVPIATLYRLTQKYDKQLEFCVF